MLHRQSLVLRGASPTRNTTMVQHLDLIAPSTQSDTDQHSAKQTIQATLRQHQRIVVIAGAGISVSAGIPDFRSPDGIFQQLQDGSNIKASGKDLFHASVYANDDTTTQFHTLIRELSRKCQDARPTIFHRMLASLAREGRLLRLYTQNIDGLESQLPQLVTDVPLSPEGPWPMTIQLHGGLDRMVCQKCQTISVLQAELFEGSTPPDCPECITLDARRTIVDGKRSLSIGRLRPRIVLYDENNPEGDTIGAVLGSDIQQKPDTLIVVGTTLKLDGVKSMVRKIAEVVRRQKDGAVIWINPEPLGRKDLEKFFTLTVRGYADTVATIVNLPRKIEQLVVRSRSMDDEEHPDADTTTSSSSTGDSSEEDEPEQAPRRAPVGYRRVIFLPAWH
jgi:NAD-dependent histone deacetylase SIR2